MTTTNTTTGAIETNRILLCNSETLPPITPEGSPSIIAWTPDKILAEYPQLLANFATIAGVLTYLPRTWPIADDDTFISVLSNDYDLGAWKLNGKRSRGLLSMPQFRRAVQHACPQYDYRSDIPHVPSLPHVFYNPWNPTPNTGGVELLRTITRRLWPNISCEFDTILIMALWLTPMWGGPGGQRPALVVRPATTEKQTRGIGKTTLIDTVASVYGGFLAYQPEKESLDKLITRMLTPTNLQRCCRVDNLRTYSARDLTELITSPAISGKRMYVGEGGRANDYSYLVSVNECHIDTDLASRSVIINMTAPTNVQRTQFGTLSESIINSTPKRKILLSAIQTTLQTTTPWVIPDSGFRFRPWLREVLAKVCRSQEECRAILDYIAAGSAQVDAEEEFVNQYIDSLVDLAQIEPDGFIPTAMLLRRYCDISNTKIHINTLSARIKHWVDSGRITVLTKVRRNYANGYCLQATKWLQQRAEVEAEENKTKDVVRGTSETPEIPPSTRGAQP